MDALLASSLGVGFVLGIRHALEPDHLVAVSTIVSERSGLSRASLVGSFWGLGHASALLGAGGLILFLRIGVPAAVASKLEYGVAAMLVALGAAAMRRALAGFRLHAHRHAHDGREHIHLHAHPKGSPHAHEHRHPLVGGLRPFLVGVVHGLAGSAGLALLVAAAAPSPLAGLAYIAALGAGSLAGMLVLSSLMSLPLALLRERYATLQFRFQLLAGASSLAFGLWLFGHRAWAGP